MSNQNRPELPVTVNIDGNISIEDAVEFAPVLVTLKKAKKMQDAGTPMTDSHFIAYTHKVGTRSFKEAAFLFHSFREKHPSVLVVGEATEAA